MGTYSRREFIRTAGGGVASALTAGAGANTLFSGGTAEPITIGVIGVNSMGFGLLQGAVNQPNIVCRALCDVDRNVLERRAAEITEQTGRKPELYGDYRRLLERSDIDAVLIATPDHWHCLMAVHALQAGKHVYVEKPLARTIAEGELIARAAERYGKLVQVGQHQRSGEHWRYLVPMIREGRIGKVRTVSLWANFDYGLGPVRQPDQAVPGGVDYAMWLGPAPQQPFNPNRFHGVWRFNWDYGGGMITDWGAHLFDIPLWALDIEGPPRSVSSAGGIFSGEDRAIDMPDTQTVIYQFDDLTMTWEHTSGLSNGHFGRNYGIAFRGEKGTLVVNREGWELHPEMEDEQPLTEAVPLTGPGARGHHLHLANFFDAIRNGSELHCPAEEGQLAAYYGHIGNLAHRTGRRLQWDRDGNLRERERYASHITPEYHNGWQLPVL